MKKLPEKVVLAVKKLDELGKKPKGTSIDILNQLTKLGYQWDNESKLWINASVQTTILIRSDETIIDELVDYLRECIESFESADLELKNNPLIYQAKDKKGVFIENMQQCYLVYNNNSLEDTELELDEKLDIDSILKEDK
jgi:hypothetical protein